MRRLVANALFVLLLISPDALLAQPSGAEARKPYVRCSAVFGGAVYLTEDKQARDSYTDIFMMLGVWASELDPALSSKESVEQVSRELQAELLTLGPELKKAKEQPSESEEFRKRLNAELETCKTFFRDAADQRQKK
jgi:hypothetical protein